MYSYLEIVFRFLSSENMMVGLELGNIPKNINDQVTKSGGDGYDVIVVPTKSSGQRFLLDQEMKMESQNWESFVLARLSDSVKGVDSKREDVRRKAQESLRQELAAVSYLGLKAAILTLGSGDTTNLARLVGSHSVWAEVAGNRWDWWNRFRLMTDSSKVKVCLRLTEKPLTDLQLERWLGEPVAAVS